MFNKKILLNGKVLRNVICPEFSGADDMGFSLIAAMECGSRGYYLPSYQMLSLHEESRKNALYSRDGHYVELYALYKSLFKNGYRPVLSKFSSGSEAMDKPEWRATRVLPVIRHEW